VSANRPPPLDEREVVGVLATPVDLDTLERLESQRIRDVRVDLVAVLVDVLALALEVVVVALEVAFKLAVFHLAAISPQFAPRDK
jgi:hypothetical protein